MIARVRIAPLEHWCEGVRELKATNYARLPGTPVEIYIHKLDKWAHCDGRVWVITHKSAEKCAEICDYHGELNHKPGFCEHMLEMD